MNDNKNLLILGAGQYGQVAREIAEQMGIFREIDFLDDSAQLAVGRLDDCINLAGQYKYAVVAIGNPDLRLAYLEKLESAGYNLATLVSSNAYLSPSATIEDGCIIEAFSAVNAHSHIGRGTFLCLSAIVNHDSKVGDGCTLQCGSIVPSNMTVPKKTRLCYREVFEDKKYIVEACDV